MENAAVKWFHMSVHVVWDVLYKTDHSFLYLLEMVSLYPSKCINVPYLKNAAVIWFHMRCAYSMGRPDIRTDIFLVLIRNCAL